MAVRGYVAALAVVGLCLAAAACRSAAPPSAAPPSAAPVSTTPSAGPTADRTPGPGPTVGPSGVPVAGTRFPAGLRPPVGTAPIGPTFGWPDNPNRAREQLLLVTGDPYAALRDLAGQLHRAGFTALGTLPPCRIGPLTVSDSDPGQPQGYLLCEFEASHWQRAGRVTSFVVDLAVSPPGVPYQATMVVKSRVSTVTPAECAAHPTEACATRAPRLVDVAVPPGRAPVRPGPVPAPPTLLGSRYTFASGDPARPVLPGSVAVGPVHTYPGCEEGGFAAVMRDDGTNPDLLAGYVAQVAPNDLWVGTALSPTAVSLGNPPFEATVATARGDDGARYVLIDYCGT